MSCKIYLFKHCVCFFFFHQDFFFFCRYSDIHMDNSPLWPTEEKSILSVCRSKRRSDFVLCNSAGSESRVHLYLMFCCSILASSWNHSIPNITLTLIPPALPLSQSFPICVCSTIQHSEEQNTHENILGKWKHLNLEMMMSPWLLWARISTGKRCLAPSR